eukprot:10845900-Karenia_brevis.AAC.1
MKFALRDVVGSEGEREMLWMKSLAMRVWNGCSVVFFTLNPHDIWNPLLVVFSNGEAWQRKRVSLNWEDDEMKRFYDEAKASHAAIFHELAAQDPGAAAEAVHQTFRLTLNCLFNCCLPANVQTKALYPDGHPCRCEPGMIGYVLGYLGMVEPQMRFTEHMHMLMQVLGFRHPEDFFQGRRFVDTFRRVWAFVASITFRSLEGVARYLGSGSATRALQQLPLMSLTERQRKAVGAQRVKETEDAQLLGRGLTHIPMSPDYQKMHFAYWCRAYLGDATLSAADWEKRALEDVHIGSVQFGNHICLPRVCHKGRWAKLGFCRMLYWHWRMHVNEKGNHVMKRAHGLRLQASGPHRLLPPVQSCPPNPGTPLLEITFPFFFKLAPAVLFGARCNHDLGIFLRLPVLSEAIQQQLADDYDPEQPDLSELDRKVAHACAAAIARITGRFDILEKKTLDGIEEASVEYMQDDSWRGDGSWQVSSSRTVSERGGHMTACAARGDVCASMDRLPQPNSSSSASGSVAGASKQASEEWSHSWESNIEGMIDTIVDHEFYAADYATKVQPQAEGLLQTLHDSLLRYDRYVRVACADDEDASSSGGAPDPVLKDRARHLMQRLISATNRCTHK